MPAGEDGEGKHRQRSDTGDAGSEAVQSVDKVDDVGEGDKVDDGDGVGEPAEFNIGVACKGVDDLVDYQAARHGDACGDELACKFNFWGELNDVVGSPGCHHEQNCNSEHAVVDGEAGVRYQHRRPSKVRAAVNGHRHRGADAQKDSEAAKAWNRLCVDVCGNYTCAASGQERKIKKWASIKGLSKYEKTGERK